MRKKRDKKRERWRKKQNLILIYDVRRGKTAHFFSENL